MAYQPIPTLANSLQVSINSILCTVNTNAHKTTYKGKSAKAINITDLSMVTDTYSKMKGKPVILSINLSNPMVFSEFEKDANAMLVNFGVQDQALLDIITGKHEPSALLPLQMPADMSTVEKQFEDVPKDMKCYNDSQGHTYDIGYGLNWKGVIKDARTAKYIKGTR